MTDTTDRRILWRDHALAAFKKVPNSRHYALADGSLDALAALAWEWQQERAQRDQNFELDELTKFFRELAAHVPGMVQKKPGDAPPTPQRWLDPVSGQPAANPYAADPPDVQSITLLEQADPALAAHLKRTAKGTTYAYLHELKMAEAQRVRLKNIPYGAAEHAQNPFCQGVEAVVEQSKLMGEDREKAQLYQTEAVPLTLPWQAGLPRNITQRARISSANPALGALLNQAESKVKEWTRDDLAAARTAEEKARAQRISAEKRLGVPAK